MRIRVEQRHIDAGAKGSSALNCPIGLAVMDATRRRHVGVGFLSVNIYDGAHGHIKLSAKMPDEARRFVVDFEHDRPVSPFEFDLAIEVQS